MAGVTAIIAATAAVTGLGLSIDQKLKSTKAMRKAQEAQDAAVAEMKALEFHDEFAELQVPILGSELAFQQQQQSLKTGIEALQEQGPTGALGGVTKMEQARSKQGLETAARLEKEEMRLDLIRQKNEQDIANRNLGLQANILGQEIEGAGLAAKDAAQMGATATQNIVGSLGMLAGVGQESQALYPEGRGRRKGREGSITDAVDSTTTLEEGFGLRQSPLTYAGLYNRPNWADARIPFSPPLAGVGGQDYYTLADWQKQNRK
jgi:hypothetical protein